MCSECRCSQIRAHEEIQEFFWFKQEEKVRDPKPNGMHSFSSAGVQYGSHTQISQHLN